jgi:outer membrane protein OmpA-like peptidoglycan-associated protein
VEKGSDKTGGCPDTDGDALRDTEDECPAEAGPKAAFGCPDRDADRVPDHRDDCPDEAAALTIDPRKSDGCPSRVYFEESALKITEKILFASNKSTIDKRSFGLLDDIAKVLAKYPGVKKIQVEGHTDSDGKDDANLKLSQDRVDAVVKYLVGKGVAAERLVAKGFGETKPVGDNATKEGKEANRRVEFQILEQDLGPKLQKRVEKMQDAAEQAPKAE